MMLKVLSTTSTVLHTKARQVPGHGKLPRRVGSTHEPDLPEDRRLRPPRPVIPSQAPVDARVELGSRPSRAYRLFSSTMVSAASSGPADHSRIFLPRRSAGRSGWSPPAGAAAERRSRRGHGCPPRPVVRASPWVVRPRRLQDHERASQPPTGVNRHLERVVPCQASKRGHPVQDVRPVVLHGAIVERATALSRHLGREVHRRER